MLPMTHEKMRMVCQIRPIGCYPNNPDYLSQGIWMIIEELSLRLHRCVVYQNRHGLFLYHFDKIMGYHVKIVLVLMVYKHNLDNSNHHLNCVFINFKSETTIRLYNYH